MAGMSCDGEASRRAASSVDADGSITAASVEARDDDASTLTDGDENACINCLRNGLSTVVVSRLCARKNLSRAKRAEGENCADEEEGSATAATAAAAAALAAAEADLRFLLLDPRAACKAVRTSSGA